MKSVKFFRAAVCLLALLWTGSVAAQMRDVEYAAPRAPISPVEPAAGSQPELYSPAQCAQLLHELATTLQLQPYQVLVLRRTLAAHLLPANSPVHPEDASATETPQQQLRRVLSAAQLARLQQWETAQPSDRRASLVACLQ